MIDLCPSKHVTARLARALFPKISSLHTCLVHINEPSNYCEDLQGWQPQLFLIAIGIGF